ncbi:hypothetical protein ASE76_16450 [Xylophilus sp. Leaf220]|nr:hypothetical protein ASE76_16450 [Xylophilus sp. Leaf220]
MSVVSIDGMHAGASSKLEWLQVLRGIAALLVLYFHMGPHWAGVPTLAGFSKAMHFGFFGVDVFFVLSGFVVYSSARKCITATQIQDFLKRRVLRVYLGYWPVLLVFAVLPAVLSGTVEKTPKQIVKSILLLYPSGADNWLPTAWSLTYELYFYVCLAAICLLAGARRLQVVTWVVAGIVAWNAFWLIFHPATLQVGKQPLYFVLSAYFVEFLAGALISEMAIRWKSHGLDPWLWLPISVSVTLLGFSVGTTSGYFDHVDFMKAGTFGIAAVGMLFTTLFVQFSGMSAPRWLVRIGDASFSLYLIHPYLLDQMGSIRYRYLESGPAIVLTLYSLLFPGLIVLAAWIWFRLVEAPLMAWVTRPRVRRVEYHPSETPR